MKNLRQTTKQVRFFMLLICSLCQFGTYYIGDIPAALKTEILEQFSPKYGQETSEIFFSFLYTFYSIPNIVLPLMGGVLCDRIQSRTIALITSFIVALGQIIIFQGYSQQSYELMVLGRFIYGIGGEIIGIAIQSLIIKWFNNHELNFALSLSLSFLRFGSISNMIISPRIADYALFGAIIFPSIPLIVSKEQIGKN
ncbi:Major facilitator superfamily domain, general substrate transporter [Pseudocohnilembus persalinus]|uniref:Lysosomal dipeptide transporter MFSD1 n=1 Tax=Pseudocohnilembus persalinus TaxID=266149 RepID=A0A0V0R414_PSEPJ|nr:Major facilitator superfamily domain, general substrate transporter [Pseudocohnilembus persalinus]|eukprot:KRX09218.1 Major facilitator superfamily domain, general substrate transporter [Pseudocohnilembus persalinus]